MATGKKATDLLLRLERLDFYKKKDQWVLNNAPKMTRRTRSKENVKKEDPIVEMEVDELNNALIEEPVPDAVDQLNEVLDLMSPEELLCIAKEWLLNNEHNTNFEVPEVADTDEYTEFARELHYTSHSTEEDVSYPFTGLEKLTLVGTANLTVRELSAAVEEHATALKMLLVESVNRSRLTRSTARYRGNNSSAGGKATAKDVLLSGSHLLHSPPDKYAANMNDDTGSNSTPMSYFTPGSNIPSSPNFTPSPLLAPFNFYTSTSNSSPGSSFTNSPFLDPFYGELSHSRGRGRGRIPVEPKVVGISNGRPYRIQH